MVQMDTVEAVRHQNLLRLITEFGSIQAFSEIVERSHSQISQLAHESKHSKTGASRRIGAKLARHFETRTGKPKGWMDVQHQGAGYPLPTGAQALVLSEPFRSIAPVITWEAILANATELPQAFCVRVPDDSMSPRVRVGDTVELDQSLTACPGDGVLVRDSAGALYLRRYRETGAATWEAYPLNEAYRTLRSDADGLTVVAVVVGIPRQRWT